MNKIIVDTNILFSAILKVDSIISKILIENNEKYIFLTPDFTLIEINKHKEKLIKLADYNHIEYDEIYHLIFCNVIVLNNNIIPNQIFKDAKDICIDIDINDSIYVAYSLYFNAKLWTGDKKLISGLRRKNIEITIDTNEILRNIL